jgi:DNA invertase Pin-like site-specific DNA recombinase
LGPAKPTGARIFSSGISDSAKGNWHLDQSLQSKIIALAFSMAAEIERDLISQRTKEALRFKKAQGLKLGPGDRARASWMPFGRRSRAC